MSKFSNKNDIFCTERDFNNIFCDVCTRIKWNFKPQRPILHFEGANKVWISCVLGVKSQVLKLILIEFAPSIKKCFQTCKWIYVTISTFVITEEMAPGQQLLRQIVLTYARIIYILVCTRLALPWGLFAIFAHHHYYVDHVTCIFFIVGWHSLVTTNSQTKLMPFLAPVGET